MKEYPQVANKKDNLLDRLRWLIATIPLISSTFNIIYVFSCVYLFKRTQMLLLLAIRCQALSLYYYYSNLGDFKHNIYS